MNIISRNHIWLALLLACFPIAVTAVGSDFKVKVQLAWGTDDMKPDGQSLRELDPKIREKLSHLRWKNYFVVKSDTVAVSHKDAARITLSDKCAVETRDKGDGNLEVCYFSLKQGAQPKLVDRVSYPIHKLKDGHVFVNAGDSKEKWGDAWLIILTAED